MSARRRCWWLIVLPALLIVGASAVRYLATGSIRVDENDMPEWAFVLNFVLFVGPLAAATYAYLGIVLKRSGFELGREETVSLARWLYVLSALALPMLSNDVFNVIAYGDLALAGRNPMISESVIGFSRFQGYVGASWAKAPCVYGPLSLALASASVALGGGLLGSVLAFKAFMLVFGLVYIEAISRAVPKQESERWNLTALVVLAPVVWLQGVGQAHCDMAMAAMMACGLRFGLSRRFHTAALFVGLAIAFKSSAATMLAVLPFLIVHAVKPMRQRLKTLLISGAVVCATVVAAYAPYWQGAATVSVPAGFVARRDPYGSASVAAANVVAAGEAILASMAAARIRSGWERFDGPIAEHSRMIQSLAEIFLQVLSATLVLWQLRRASWDARGIMHAYAKAVVILVGFSMPVFRPWYLLMAIPFFILCDSRRWVVWAAVASGLVNLGDAAVMVGQVDPRSLWRPLWPALGGILTLPAAAWFFADFRARFLRDPA